MLGHPLAATIGDSARCMQNLEKVVRSKYSYGFPMGRFRHQVLVVHHQYPSAPEIKDLRTVHASGNERIFRLRSRS